MKILLSCFFLASSATAFGQFPLQQEWLQKWDNARDYTLECLSLMPEESLGFQPIDSVMTFNEQVVHICKNMTWLANRYLGKSPAFEFDWETDVSNKAELMELVTEAYQYGREAVEVMKKEDLEMVHEFFAGPMTGRQIMNLMQDHQTHHRGQLIVYLRLNNLKPPRYRGW
jgi:uncharacterized damage-inducible protein DinB